MTLTVKKYLVSQNIFIALNSIFTAWILHTTPIAFFHLIYHLIISMENKPTDREIVIIWKVQLEKEPGLGAIFSKIM